MFTSMKLTGTHFSSSLLTKGLLLFLVLFCDTKNIFPFNIFLKKIFTFLQHYQHKQGGRSLAFCSLALMFFWDEAQNRHS